MIIAHKVPVASNSIRSSLKDHVRVAFHHALIVFFFSHTRHSCGNLQHRATNTDNSRYPCLIHHIRHPSTQTSTTTHSSGISILYYLRAPRTYASTARSYPRQALPSQQDNSQCQSTETSRDSKIPKSPRSRIHHFPVPFPFFSLRYGRQ
jgi:hypothetical protein